MNKTTYKIVDEWGRITIPKALRDSYSIASGDVVGITADGRSIAVRKAIIMDDRNYSMDVKIAHVMGLMREFKDDAIADIVEYGVKRLKENVLPF